MEDEYIDEAMQSTIAMLKSPSLCMATELRIKRPLSLRQQFVDRAAGVFSADTIAFVASQLPAKMAPSQLSCMMNNNSLAIDAMIAVVSGMQLTARWHYPFSVWLTKERPFFLDEGQNTMPAPRQVATMRLIDTLSYRKHATFTSVDLCLFGMNNHDTAPRNYSGCLQCEYVMTVLLPDALVPLSHLEKYLFWQTVLAADPYHQTNRLVDLRLPRFKITTQLAVMNLFSHMGKGDLILFEVNDVGKPTHGVGQDIRHYAHIDVNEAGLLSSVATANRTVSFNDWSAQANEAVVIDVNRPFMFLVWHHSPRVVLLAGSIGICFY